MDTAVLGAALAHLFTVEVLLAVTAGVVGGIVIGALPGLSGTMAIALLIPVTFGMDPVAGLAMLAAIYAAAVYGGSISAILINAPGTPASAATALDGYAMTRKGEGAKALGISAISSTIGGFISGVVLLFVAPQLARISLAFSAAEYFLIAVFGLTIIGGLSGKSVLKGVISGVIGVVAATVGIDILTGYPRFSFGTDALQSGIALVPALIGLFSLSQVMILAEERRSSGPDMGKLVRGKVLPRPRELVALAPTLARSSAIGVFVGILPGAGGDIGSWVGYNETRRYAKDKSRFGKGAPEGVAAPESANNAVTGGAMIPLLTLGIPGSSATAVLLGGLLIQGLQPGHALFTDDADITYAVMLAFLLANLLMGAFALAGARLFVKITNVPVRYLAPSIVVLCVVGSYSINNSVADVWMMVVFGLIGYLLRKTGFPTAPVVLGLILGSVAEKGLRQSIVLAQGDVLGYYLSRPISLVMIALILLSLLAPLLSRRLGARTDVPQQHAPEEARS
jgi:putative tricarboxylic transport membrane protein